jgi:hypothetical protein
VVYMSIGPTLRCKSKIKACNPSVRTDMTSLFSNKVVADGAISGILDKPVGTRVSRYSSGVLCNTHLVSGRLDHAQRRYKSYKGLDGKMMIPGYFDTILGRVSVVKAYLTPF